MPHDLIKGMSSLPIYTEKFIAPPHWALGSEFERETQQRCRQRIKTDRLSPGLQAIVKHATGLFRDTRATDVWPVSVRVLHQEKRRGHCHQHPHVDCTCYGDHGLVVYVVATQPDGARYGVHFQPREDGASVLPAFKLNFGAGEFYFHTGSFLRDYSHCVVWGEEWKLTERMLVVVGLHTKSCNPYTFRTQEQLWGRSGLLHWKTANNRIVEHTPENKQEPQDCVWMDPSTT
jgi:hypothetical protein